MLSKVNVFRQRSDLAVWHGHLELGSWGQRLHLRREYQPEGLEAECGALRVEQGGFIGLRRDRDLGLLFPLESVFWEGPFPEVGG